MEYRDDFKVVVMSATINLEKFTQYFNTQNYMKEATADYLTCSYYVVEMIVKNNPKGDILLFFTTTREIEEACAMIRRRVPGLQVLPLYSALQSEAQSQGERTISWEYRTTKSKYINPNYIDWSAFGGDRAMAHGACIANYDGHKLAALDAYNREYIVRRTTPEDIESWCHRSFINGRVAAQVMTIRN
ncbi:hypothetical protein BHE90_008681 [Fusarium euwallaceae]|uniref:Helicase C-terminal domain-containing protein n=1 Tax=Fusarium euwallaceae TaxID=1147111 RepID=A0A430LMA8_9HYPO|nr:hypothetical protein BHE90_008681 [Fusarium euwallaceae]